MNPEKVFIIGAPRSGTNMLRDALTSFEGISTWPCDEINYIWRYGNATSNSDQISPSKANQKIKNYIEKKFNQIAKRNKSKVIIEKTCANSLRIPFIEKLFPESKYIFIYRDGYDAACSAQIRWKSKMNIRYIYDKVKYVPITDLPYYSLRYLWTRIYKIFSKEKHLAFWGPVLPSMRDIIKNNDLDQVCAIQWEQCVNKALDALEQMHKEKVLYVKYETFVKNPAEEIKRILIFLHHSTSESHLHTIASKISANNVGKGKRSLSKDDFAKINKLISSTMHRLNSL